MSSAIRKINDDGSLETRQILPVSSEIKCEHKSSDGTSTPQMERGRRTGGDSRGQSTTSHQHQTLHPDREEIDLNSVLSHMIDWD